MQRMLHALKTLQDMTINFGRHLRSELCVDYRRGNSTIQLGLCVKESWIPEQWFVNVNIF